MRSIAPAYTVGAVCVIERSDGAVMLVRLSYRNSWGLPGGLLKRGETPAQAALREVREESTLEVDLVGDPAVVVDAPAQRVDVIFRARVADGHDVGSARAASPEIVEIAWFPRDDLPDLQVETSSALMALARRAVTPSVD